MITFSRIKNLILCVFVLMLPCAIWIWPVRIPFELSGSAGNNFTWDLYCFLRSRIIVFAALALIPFLRRWQSKAFTALVLLTLALTDFPHLSLYGFTNSCEGVLVILSYFVLYETAFSIGLTKSLERCLLLTVWLVAIFGLQQYVMGSPISDPIHHWLWPKITFTSIRFPIASTLYNPNHVGLFCALMAPFALARGKWLTFCVAVGLALACESRAAWFSIVLTSGILLLGKKGTILAVTGLVTCWLVFNPHSIHWPMRGTDLSARVFMWKRTLPMLKDTLLVGKGPGTFALFFPQKESKEFFGANTITERPHNMAMSTAHAFGLPALLVLSWFIWKRRNLAVLGFLICGMFTDSMVGVTPYFFILLGTGL